MNPIYLLAFSLFFIPLCGPVIIEPIIGVYDLWQAKEFLVIIFISGIALSAYSAGNHHRAKTNYWLIALMLFLPISAFSAPPLKIIYGHENLAGLWIWRCMAWAYAYFMAYCAIAANPPVQDRHKKMIVQAIGWAAIISAGYAYIQALGLDQWQIARPRSEIWDPAVPHITAMIGNPTYLATWLVMCLPFVVLFFAWPWAVLVFGAVLLCHSDIAVAGSGLTVVFALCLRARRTIWLKTILGCVLTIIALIMANWGEIRPKIHDNGRFAVWAQTFEDWQSPCITIPIHDGMSSAQKADIEKLNKRTYALTGRGLGSFPYIFSPKYGTKFDSAHNEHLEGPYTIGLIGQGLFWMTIFFVFLESFSIAKSDKFTLALYLSLFFCCIAAFGLPILHIEPLRYFSATMFCLLSSLIQRK